MRELPYRAIIVDLDRTLLRTDKSVSAYTRTVLKKWQDAGAFLYAATARPERAVEEYRRMFSFRSMTTLNGARTILPDGVSENTIGRAGAASLLEQLDRTAGTVISVEAEHGLFANLPIPVWEPAVVSDIVKLPERERIYKVLASHPEMPPDEIPVIPPEDVYCTVADKKLIQFMSRTATKWNGIRQMLAYDWLDAGQAICFGDDNDDIEPIRECGCGVAVRNALECVKEAADAVTESNDEDGVARFLDRLVRL